jgi:hypothetical protein
MKSFSILKHVVHIEPLGFKRLRCSAFMFIVPKSLSQVELVYIIPRLRHN